MRMIHYFGTAVLVTLVALFVTAWLGISGQVGMHFRISIVTAILTIGTHSLLILFMVITGRIIREAITSRSLSREYLAESNEFFATKQAYPAALLGAVSIVIAGVLATAQGPLGLPAGTHMLAGVVALCVNLYAFGVEVRTVLANQVLVDRVAVALDAIDRDLESRGALPEDPPPVPGALARSALSVGLGSWLPYLYWGLVVWRGDFEQVSIHPWLELSVIGLIVWVLARQGSGAESPAPRA